MPGTDPATQPQLDLIARLCEKADQVTESFVISKDDATREINRLKAVISQQNLEQAQAREAGAVSRERKGIARDASNGVVGATGFRDDETTRDNGGGYSKEGLGDYEPEEATERQQAYLQKLCRDHGIPYDGNIARATASKMIDQLAEATEQTKFSLQFGAMNPVTREAVLEVLPDLERGVLTGLYLEGRTPNEVAGQLGVPRRTVDLRDAIARDKVRRVLEGGYLERATARSHGQSL